MKNTIQKLKKNIKNFKYKEFLNKLKGIAKVLKINLDMDVKNEQNLYY